MLATSHTTTIAVTIGRRTRHYRAFITTAPRRLDTPSTVTLCATPLADAAMLAANDIPLDGSLKGSLARVILVDVQELEWQRARCRQGRHVLIQPDPALLSTAALQTYLWQRLRLASPECIRANNSRKGSI